MENSYKYLKNEACAYFPCHVGYEGDAFNCMFCYCPMYCYKDCLGQPDYKKTENGKLIKMCDKCTYPHVPENYDKIVAFLKKKYCS